MKKSLLLVFVSCSMIFGGCLAPAFYADIRGNEYANPGAVTSSGGKVLTGSSCWNSYVGIVALGDASVASAMKNAGVDPTKPVKNLIVDHKVYTIGPFYMEYCTVVTVTTEGGGSNSVTPGTSESAAESSDGDKSGKSEGDSFDWKSD